MKNLLIDEAKEWYRMWSVRLAAIAGVIAAYLAANPEQSQLLINSLPEGPLRTFVAFGIGLFVFSLATGARLVKQPGSEK